MSNASATAKVSFYNPATGLFTGDRYTGAEPALNCPPGQAWVDGVYKPDAHAVQLITDDFGNQVPTIVPYQPPAPPATEWETWGWDGAQHRWVSQPTLAALKRAANQPLLRQLEALDVKVVRPAGEIAEALVQGLAAPADSLQRLQQLNAEKAQIRQQLQAIAASTSADQLASLELQRTTLEPTP